MAMPMKDFRQLEKLMMMTTSDNDAEALSSLRMANKILVKHNYNWTSAFKRLIVVEDNNAPEIDVAPDNNEFAYATALKARIRNAFEVLDYANLGDFGDFIDSLKKQFNERGRLTEGQMTALFKAADREAKR